MKKNTVILSLRHKRKVTLHEVPARHLAHAPFTPSKWSTKDAGELSDRVSNALPREPFFNIFFCYIFALNLSFILVVIKIEAMKVSKEENNQIPLALVLGLLKLLPKHYIKITVVISAALPEAHFKTF